MMIIREAQDILRKPGLGAFRHGIISGMPGIRPGQRLSAPNVAWNRKPRVIVSPAPRMSRPRQFGIALRRRVHGPELCVPPCRSGHWTARSAPLVTSRFVLHFTVCGTTIKRPDDVMYTPREGHFTGPTGRVTKRTFSAYFAVSISAVV